MVLNKKCSCIGTVETLYNTVTPSAASCPSWTVYIATHILLNPPTKINLRATPVNANEKYEIGFPISYDIGCDLSNTRISVSFGDNSKSMSLINRGIVFHDYSLPSDQYTWNISAVSLSNSLINEQLQLNVKITPKTDTGSMQSIEITIMSVSNMKVTGSLAAAGGMPYTCTIDLGDGIAPKQTLVASSSISTFQFLGTYTAPGIYNITAECKSTSAKVTSVSDAAIVFVPDTKSAQYQPLKTSQYSYDNRKYIMYSKKTANDIDLEIPVRFMPMNYKLNVVDMLSQSR